MSAIPNRFVRRISLNEDEYRKNFRQIDRDAIELLKSAEARQVTRLMGTLYLTLIDAPPEYWEREGVLRFTGGEGEGELRTAWQQLVSLLDCGNTTAKKALDWMHGRGLIGYYAGKNGVGIRIFINRALNSIGRRAEKKNLRLVRAPVSSPATPAAGTPFKDSYAVLDVLEKDLNPRAPEIGAEKNEPVEPPPDSQPTVFQPTSQNRAATRGVASRGQPRLEDLIEEIVSRLGREMEPSLRAAAQRAAAREHERTREWLESRGLPKAARVAQRESYNVLRKYGLIREVARSTETGASCVSPARVEQSISAGEVEELAQACLAMLEVKERPIDQTLAEMSAEAGGFLQPADVSRIRARAAALLDARRP